MRALPATLDAVQGFLGRQGTVPIDEALAWTPRPEAVDEMSVLVDDWDGAAATGWATVVAEGRDTDSLLFSQAMHFLVARGICRWLLDDLYEPQKREELMEVTERHIGDWLGEQIAAGHVPVADRVPERPGGARHADQSRLPRPDGAPPLSGRHIRRRPD